jgi:hypothetical protein
MLKFIHTPDGVLALLMHNHAVAFSAGLTGLTGQFPSAQIGGQTVSLAGLVLPALFSLWVLRGQSVKSLGRTGLWLLLLSWLANLVWVAHQYAQGFPGSGVHLTTVVPFLSVISLSQRKQIASPLQIAALTWVSMFPLDLMGSVLMGGGHVPMAQTLEWVGGAGWLDGLLLIPLGGAVSTLVCHGFSRLPRRRLVMPWALR